MTGVGFDDQPDFASGFELQGVAGGEGQVNVHRDAAIDARGNDHVATLQRDQPAGDYVAGAESYRFYDSQQNVAGANSDAQARAGLGSNQRRLQKNGTILFIA